MTLLGGSPALYHDKLLDENGREGLPHHRKSGAA
jgi:hypothetical protein